MYGIRSTHRRGLNCEHLEFDTALMLVCEQTPISCTLTREKLIPFPLKGGKQAHEVKHSARATRVFHIKHNLLFTGACTA